MGYSRKTVILVTLLLLLAFPISRNFGGLQESPSTSSLLISSSGALDFATTKVQYVFGDKIIDEKGKEMIWRGAGGSYLFHSDDYLFAWEKHLPQIQKMNLNTVRLAFRFPDSNPGNDGYVAADTLNYTKLDEVVGFLDQHNLKAILDLHNCGDMYGDFGSQKLVEDWVRLANHYRGDSRIVAYELFNEPYSATWDPSVKTKWDVFHVYANLTREIRRVDPYHIHIWESDSYYLPPLEEIVGGLESDIVFTAHRWWTSRFGEFDLWTPEQIANLTLAYIAEARTRFNRPFWLGEFGAGYPFNSSNSEWLLTKQLLSRCEEQAISWNLWMGRTDKDRPWDQYLDFFPLSVYNGDPISPLQLHLPKLTEYVVEQNGREILEFYRAEMWHNDDYITIKPGITILVITNHALPDGSLEITSKEKIEVMNQLTIRNEEGTTTHPGDWNIMIYVVPST